MPTCKLGRIGLSIYRKDPKFVYAIVESEKIAKVPANAAYLGVRSEDADFGARLTSITDESPAAKAELKEGDIVVMVGKKLIHSNGELLAEIRRHQAKDKVKFTVSRERKQIEIDVELGKRPERSRSNPFTGTLGGQAANLQGQQGTEGYQYGGIYLSKDSGKSWTRINSLNPRPMYYSQVRVDPSDRNHLLFAGPVCTSRATEAKSLPETAVATAFTSITTRCGSTRMTDDT